MSETNLIKPQPAVKHLEKRPNPGPRSANRCWHLRRIGTEPSRTAGAGLMLHPVVGRQSQLNLTCLYSITYKISSHSKGEKSATKCDRM